MCPDWYSAKLCNCSSCPESYCPPGIELVIATFAPNGIVEQLIGILGGSQLTSLRQGGIRQPLVDGVDVTVQ
ncbi:hypothetical protein RRG08_012546 [Elysia crispata]|uniref:Uncharacterized protein n=1 Tax=Elysia crispata TaxID=231223 RepID=A0AAE1AP20_9GAST|nr:hypothetical protein RRG08_012546 [Elysia crispata]